MELKELEDARKDDTRPCKMCKALVKYGWEDRGASNSHSGKECFAFDQELLDGHQIEKPTPKPKRPAEKAPSGEKKAKKSKRGKK